MTQEITRKLHGGGPKTPAGKARSAMNATRHGLTAESAVVLADEDPAEFQALHEQYIADFGPASGAERDLVYEIAACQWRLRRTLTIESAMFDMAIDRTETSVNAEWEGAPQPYILAAAWNHMADDGSGYKLLNRYEARLTRRYDKAIAMLRQLKADRSAPRESRSTLEAEINEEALMTLIEAASAPPAICETNSPAAPVRENCETNSPAGPENYQTNSPLPAIEKYKDQRWPDFIPVEHATTPFAGLPKVFKDLVLSYERLFPPHLRAR